MLTPEHTETRRADEQAEATRDRTKMTILLPVKRVLRDGDMIDRVIAAVFDRLAYTSVELRVLGKPEE